MKFWWIIAVFILINIGQAREQSKMRQIDKKVPQYLCKHVSRELELSGRLDDPLWETADVVFLNDAVTGEPGRYRTEVRVLYSDHFLYVGFRCEDEFCWGTVTERNGPIWSEECVEIFINPADVPHQYYELNLSPLNVIYDACVLTNRTALQPNGKIIPLTSFNLENMKTAVWIDGKPNQPDGAKAWCAAYAIPLADIWGSPNTPPESGDFWRINFYRIDSPVKKQRESYSWTHIRGERFHLPWLFGYLIFE